MFITIHVLPCSEASGDVFFSPSTSCLRRLDFPSLVMEKTNILFDKGDAQLFSRRKHGSVFLTTARSSNVLDT